MHCEVRQKALANAKTQGFAFFPKIDLSAIDLSTTAISHLHFIDLSVARSPFVSL